MAKPMSNRLTPAQFNKLSIEQKDEFVNTLKNYYFVQNLLRDEVLDKMNITISCLKHVMKLYNLKKDKSLVQKNIDKTFIEKYGRTGWVNREQIKNTMIARYGVDNISKNKDIIEKRKETCRKKYGGNAPACNKEILQKIQNTCLEKYGYDNIRLSPHYKDVIKQKMSKTMQDRYNVPYYCLTSDCINAQGHIISKVNLRFAELLQKNGIKFEQEYKLENVSYDFKVGNTLLEINPTYTHNSTVGPIFKGSQGKPKECNYHLHKSNIAKKHGYHCIHIFDWDDWDKIINLLLPKQTIYARKCEIREVSKKECDLFLNTYHLQNTCNNQKIRYGLYYNDILVQIMTFGKPRYNKNYEYELLRLCSHKDYVVVGGSERLFKYFLNNYNSISIISYCDNSKFSGEVYEHLGMKFKCITNPVGNWYNLENKLFISDALLRQRGFDQLFNTNYGKNTSNYLLMIENGFLQVYNCGQKVFTLNKN